MNSEKYPSGSEKYPPPQERFKLVLLSLSELMKKELNKARNRGMNVISENIIDFAIVIIKEVDSNNLIQGFIERSFPLSEGQEGIICCWNSVLKKDKEFFFENSSLIFGELSSGIIDGIAVVLKKESNEHLMEGMWKHLYSMVKICINYIYLKKEPKVEMLKEGGYLIKYANNENFNYIHIEELASKWNVNLLNAK